MRRRLLFTPLVLLIAASASSAVPTPLQDEDPFEEVLAGVKDLMLRLPLRYHVAAYEMLVRSRDPRGIEELAGHYDRPQLPKDQSRYLMAKAIDELGKKGCTADVVAALGAWRSDADESRDAWLWRHALEAEIEGSGPDIALQVARESKDVMLRGAAVEALAAHKHEALYEAVPELARDLPKKDAEQVAFVGALVTALGELGNEKTRVETPWKLMALSLIALLEDDDLPRSAKLVIARYLANELDTDQVVLEAGAWRAQLSALSREAKEKKRRAQDPESAGDEDRPEYVRPRFFGVEVTGERICYLIDLSDSMAAPIPDSWRPEGAPLSGPDEVKRPKRKRGELPTEADIPWALVRTRFDLAREHLRVSLERLQPDQKFTVIGFGTRAEFLDGCEGMVKASSGNVRKVLKALDSIDIGQPQGERVHGTIWGDTNFHAGIKLAFATTKKGAVDDAEYVDLDTFEDGADTIFVLSDGDPSADDYTVTDIDYGDGTVVTDAESKNRAAERTMKMDYFGPYAHWPFLLTDIERMNMFRECEIHVISVGDADPTALQLLARIGLGQVKIFGADD